MPWSSSPSGLNIEPGQYVRNPRQPDWGLGQVQSAIGARVTVTFENAGKVLMNVDIVPLDVVDSPQQRGRGAA